MVGIRSYVSKFRQYFIYQVPIFSESDLCSWRSLTFLEPEICWAGNYSILGELDRGITGSTWAPRSQGTSRWTAPSRERRCERLCKNLDQNEQILEQTRLSTFRSSSWCCSEERGGCRTSRARKSQIAKSWTIIMMITRNNCTTLTTSIKSRPQLAWA